MAEPSVLPLVCCMQPERATLQKDLMENTGPDLGGSGDGDRGRALWEENRRRFYSGCDGQIVKIR
jgi:hypothetical protein